MFIDEIVQHIKKYKYEDIPPVAVYFQIYLALREGENLDNYFKLKDLLELYGNYFPINEAKNIYDSALNYCIRKINQGNQQFLREYFDLINIMIERETIYTDNKLSPWDFKNIVVIALRLGEYEWTENFILNFKERLLEDFRENAVTYNLAQLYFYQKKYNKVLSLLQERSNMRI